MEKNYIKTLSILLSSKDTVIHACSNLHRKKTVHKADCVNALFFIYVIMCFKGNTCVTGLHVLLL